MSSFSKATRSQPSRFAESPDASARLTKFPASFAADVAPDAAAFMADEEQRSIDRLLLAAVRSSLLSDGRIPGLFVLEPVACVL